MSSEKMWWCNIGPPFGGVQFIKKNLLQKFIFLPKCYFLNITLYNGTEVCYRRNYRSIYQHVNSKPYIC